MKILIVDDDRTNRMVLNALLTKEGYEVLAAEDGQQAVELFEREPPDMVLMDVMMPIMDGYEATRQIKAATAESGAFVPVIFLTALNDEAALSECVACGGDDFLTKPYSRVILRSKIQALERVRNLYETIKEQRDVVSRHQLHILREQEIAEKVFAQIVHPGVLDLPVIRYLLSPMSIFNGDLLLAARKPSGGMHVILGDFTGHGLPASIGAIPVSEVFYGMTSKGFSIGDIVAETNKKLLSVLPAEIFFAACYLEIDKDLSTLAVWHGGVPDVLIYSAEGQVRYRVASTHLPLGVVDNTKLNRNVEIVELQEGDQLYAYSDGVIEATNQAEEMFGQSRLEEIFTHNTDPNQLFDDILAGLETFRTGASQSDDITMIEIKCDRSGAESLKIDTSVAVSSELPAREWRYSLELRGATLREFDPLPQVIQLLMDIQGLHEHRERIYTVLAELYINALDHGLLELDSMLKRTPEGFTTYYQTREERLSCFDAGWIKIDLAHAFIDTGGQLTLMVKDSGAGFDLEKVRGMLEGNLGFAGRGIPLVQSLCSSLRYDEQGTRATAVYEWEQ